MKQYLGQEQQVRHFRVIRQLQGMHSSCIVGHHRTIGPQKGLFYSIKQKDRVGSSGIISSSWSLQM